MKSVPKRVYLIGSFVLFLILCSVCLAWAGRSMGTVTYSSESYLKEQGTKLASSTSLLVEALTEKKPEAPKLDTKDYDKRMLVLAHYKAPVPIRTLSTSTNASGTIVKKYSTTTPPSPLVYSSSTNVTIKGKLWPKAQPYPLPGAILPFKRILAYYGNF